MTVELAVLGGGRMGGAIAGGLLAARRSGTRGAAGGTGVADPGTGVADPGTGAAGPGTGAADLVVVERSAERRADLAARRPNLRVEAALPAAAGVVLAVKPPDVPAACEEIAALAAPPRRVLSIAAGVTTAALRTWLGPDGPAVLRAMPNTPALVGAGASAVAAGAGADRDDLAWAESILRAVGTVVTVDERLLDAVTGLSGSGPAYVFLVAEALIDAGVLVGLPRPVARDLTVQTLLGAARLLAETGEAPEALRAGVTSPGGTTAAGLRALEVGGVRAAMIDAVVAATARAAELGVA